MSTFNLYILPIIGSYNHAPANIKRHNKNTIKHSIIASKIMEKFASKKR